MSRQNYKVSGLELFTGTGIVFSDGSVQHSAFDLSTVTQSIIPSVDTQYDLGSIDKQWRSLYVSTGTIYIGGIPLTVNTETSSLLVGTGTSTSSVTLATEDYVQQAVAQLPSVTGNITFNNETISAPNGSGISIESKYFGGMTSTSLQLIPESAVAKLESNSVAIHPFLAATGDFLTAQWTSILAGEETHGQLVFSSATSVYNFLQNDPEWTISNINKRNFRVNSGDYLSFSSVVIGWDTSTNTLSIDLGPQFLPPIDPTGIEQFDLQWNNTAVISIDSNGDKSLTLDSNTLDILVTSTKSINIDAMSGANIRALSTITLKTYTEGGSVKIETDELGSTSTWSFNSTGTVTFPDGTMQATAWTGTVFNQSLNTSDSATFDQVNTPLLNFGTYTLGTPGVGGIYDKIRLYNFSNPSLSNYAIGVEPNHMWFGVDVATAQTGFKFYGSNTEVLSITGDGKIHLVSGGDIVDSNDQSVLTGNAKIVSPPATSTSTGVAGSVAYNESYFYACTATNAWQRISWDITPW